jgi:hypothetical protein
MKKIKRITKLILVATLITSCSENVESEVKPLSTENSGDGIEPLTEEVVSEPFSEYFQIIDNESSVERMQDGDWVQYEFKTLIKIIKPFPCVAYNDENSVFDHNKMQIKLKFYDGEKKPLSINGTQDLEFFTHANTTVGKGFCDVIGQKEGSEEWYSFKTRNLKKGETDYFEAYPDGEIKYYSFESAL